MITKASVVLLLVLANPAMSPVDAEPSAPGVSFHRH